MGKRKDSLPRTAAYLSREYGLTAVDIAVLIREGYAHRQRKPHQKSGCRYVVHDLRRLGREKLHELVAAAKAAAMLRAEADAQRF